MNRPDFVLIAPDPYREDVPNPGGQRTVVQGILEFANENNFKLAFIDTTQRNFPPTNLSNRTIKAIWRLLHFAYVAVFRRPKVGVIIFSAGPASFIERGLTGLLARMFRLPSVICPRSGDLVPLIGQRSILGYSVTLLFKLQSRIVVQGQIWLQKLHAVGIDPANVHIVPNWVSSTFEIHSSPREKAKGAPIRFVFVGWIVREKGIYELIEACEILSKAGNEFEMIIIGGGSHIEDIEGQIHKKNLGEHVSMTGWLNLTDVRAQLIQSDVFVLPTYFEGFPNSLIEAFACGLPAISTSVGGIPDSLRDGESGYLIPVGDAQELAGAMRRYIDDRSLIKLHSRKALEILQERHNLKTNCAKLFESVGA